MALGIRGFNPIWLEVDLQGNLFDDTFYLFVLENTIPYIPATVYHDPNLNLPWTQPIRFLGNGTLPVDIYFEPEKVYRLEFRQGDTQQDPLIYEVNNYTPGQGGVTPIEDTLFSTENQITNPQFSLINFVSPTTIGATDPDSIEVAPGWFLDLAGTGTAVITRVALNNSNTNPSNAPYALRLTLNGWTADSVFLRQRFEQNGMLWANTVVSSAITARLDGSPQDISASLIDSNDVLLTTVLDPVPVNEEWTEYTGHGEIGATTNPDVPPAAYVDYKIALPSNIDIYLTSMQLIVQDPENLTEPSFEQDTIERQVDHTFHYYKDPLIQKPIPSYLVGWDFSFNPCQALGPTVTPVVLGGPNLSRYIADQMIQFSSVDNSVGSAFNNGGVGFSTSVDSAFAIIQYLDMPTALELLQSRMAVNIQGGANVSIPCEINLYWTDDTNLPSLISPTCHSLVSAVSATGVQTTANGTWHKVPRSNGLGDVRFNLLPTLTQTYPTYSFNGWDATEDGDIVNATYFAIVVSFGTLVAANQIVLKYTSLCAGEIATKPAPLTLTQSLFQCQRYYETNYPLGAAASGANTNSLLIAPMGTSFGTTGGGAVNSYGTVANSWGIQWQSLKRRSPTVTITSQAGTAANVSYTYRFNNVTVGPANLAVGSYWAATNGVKGIVYQVAQTNFITPEASNPNGNLSSWITFNYIADCRLGIVN